MVAGTGASLHLSWFVLMATLCSASVGSAVEPLSRGGSAVGSVADLVCVWVAGCSDTQMAWAGATGRLCVLPEETPGDSLVCELVTDRRPMVGWLDSVLPPPSSNAV